MALHTTHPPSHIQTPGIQSDLIPERLMLTYHHHRSIAHSSRRTPRPLPIVKKPLLQVPLWPWLSSGVTPQPIADKGAGKRHWPQVELRCGPYPGRIHRAVSLLKCLLPQDIIVIFPAMLIRVLLWSSRHVPDTALAGRVMDCDRGERSHWDRSSGDCSLSL